MPPSRLSSTSSSTSLESTAESTCHSALISLSGIHKPLPLAPFLQDILCQVSLSPLPLDLLGGVLANLPRTSLAAVLRVNSSFYRAVIEILHAHIDLGSHCVWPRFEPASAPFWRSRARLANAVQRVDIHPHSTAFCCEKSLSLVSAHTLPALPNLDVLRVHLTHASPRSFHINEAADYRGPACPVRALLPQCPALFRLRPRRLIVFGGPCVYQERAMSILPYELTAAVERYTLVLCPGDMRACVIVADIANAANARTVSIVFYTKPGGWAGEWAGFFAELARGAASLPAWQRLNIVNAGALTHMQDAEHGMLALENTFHAALQDLPEPRWARAATIRFVTMEEHLAGEHGFEAHEIAGWRAAGAAAAERRWYRYSYNDF